MTAVVPALLGGAPTFSKSPPLVRPTIPDVPDLECRLEHSGMPTNGRVFRELEHIVAERCEVAHVVAVASCTSSLMLTLRTLGATGRVVEMTNRVLTPPMYSHMTHAGISAVADGMIAIHEHKSTVREELLDDVAGPQ
jgi:hypothetical protein